ncbi:type I restriction enzyme HsdR N-terminal domain-containing protein [Desulfovibrio aminophilus]|uniref:type I restriction enzyme HsdR N-terminal domain-containing protein n=1 Tax=Desulfovibrio aminophilus TaxID=81425 RepID=UPI00339AD4CF
MRSVKADNAHIAKSIRDAIEESPKKSKRVLLKTLLKMYGHKTRQRHWLEEMSDSLREAGVMIAPPLMEVERDGWVALSVTNPRLPVGEFIPPVRLDAEGNDNSPDLWLSTIVSKAFNSEKEVEIRFVLPLLERLGYTEEDRADGYPVEQIVGVRKTRTEADFVLFNGLNRSKDSALLVIEAKNIGKKLADNIGQARSYAMFLCTPYFMVTNGDEIRVFLYRSPIESDVEVFKSTRHDLVSTFPVLFNLVSKQAIIEYKHRRATI